MSLPDDPERLANATPPSPLGELFASAARDLPSNEQLARLAAQLGPILNSAPSAPTAPSGTSLGVKLGIGAGALALLVGAGLALRGATQTSSVSNAVHGAAAPVASAVSPPTPMISTPPTVESAPIADDASAPPALDKPGTPVNATSKKSSSVQSKPSEASLLEQARRALATSPSYALQLTNQHRALYPHGVLTQEREVIAIEALRKLHRGSEADQRATGFSKSFPGSAHQRMVDDPATK